MHYSSLLITALVAVNPALGFTNGSLIPSYICDPVNDGLPKSFGELLPYTREALCTIAFNADASQNLNTVPQYNASTGAKNGTLVMNSAFVLASFHNTLNSLQPIQQGLIITLSNGSTSLPAGKKVQLTLSSSVPNTNLDGAMLYANEGKKRVGSFTDTGGKFKAFPGCGLNEHGEFAGVVQHMIISNTSSYNKLSFNVPACVKSGNLTLAGLSVTDAGFGVFNYTFPVTGSKCSGKEDTVTNIAILDIETITLP